ncbi:MAG: helix-turn-helix transcriptional regulator [Oscillospiraceae bacterium]|nr:helix-turn-helix transcriptional regulator [Oscillospiraceae bacterium]
MNHDFARTLTLLRKEKGLSQKSVANSLGISQALLSHYEKGVRECGLNFVVKCADFYNVSCDYLLGRSAEKTGSTILVNEIPDGDKVDNKNFNIITTLNKKLISNSLTIIFEMLSRCKNNDLIMEVSYLIMIFIYKILRILHRSEKKNNSEMFKLSEYVANDYADASIKVAEGKIISIIKNRPVDKLHKMGEDKVNFDMSTKTLHEKYSALSSSLFNLIKNSEQKISDTIKSDK